MTVLTTGNDLHPRDTDTMPEFDALRFADKVRERIGPDNEDCDLWNRIGQEYGRKGPDAARGYLDAIRQQRQERVRRLLSEIGIG